MQKIGSNPRKYKNCRHEAFTPSTSPVSHYDGEDIPSMELLKINYVKSSKSKRNSYSDDRPRSEDQTKPSLYKYAVYKKLNRSSHQLDAQEFFRQCSAMEGISSDPKGAPQKLRRSNSHHGCDDEANDKSWNCESQLAALSQVTTRANRLEKIQKSSPVRPRSYHQHRRCTSPDDDSTDLTRISQRFEQVYRSRCNSPVSRDPIKFKSFVDDHPQDRSTSSSNKKEQTANTQNHQKRADEMNSRMNTKIRQMFDFDHSRSTQSRSQSIDRSQSPTAAAKKHNKCSQNHESNKRNKQKHVKSKAIIESPFDRRSMINQQQQSEIGNKKAVASGNHITLNVATDGVRGASSSAKSARSPTRSPARSENPVRSGRHLPTAILEPVCKHDQPSVTGSCGYKNCNINNCPMSHSSQPPSRATDECMRIGQSKNNKDSNSCRNKCRKSLNCDNDNIRMNSKNNSHSSKSVSSGHANNGSLIIDFDSPHEKSTKITVKLGGDEVKEVTSSTANNRVNNSAKSKGSDRNDVQNFSGKNLTKISTDELLRAHKTSTNLNLNNAIIQSAVSNSQKVNVNFRNIENRKFNDLRSINDHQSNSSNNHRLKIFVQSSSVSTSSNVSSMSSASDVSSLTDSERDYSFFDSERLQGSVISVEGGCGGGDGCDDADCGAESGISSSSDFLRNRNRDGSSSYCGSGKGSGGAVRNNSGYTASKLGCDGAIFWNNCYYYDEKCAYCSMSSGDNDDERTESFVCVCSGKQEMDVHDTRPRSMDGVLDSGISLNGDTGSSPDSDISAQHLQNQPDTEARRLKRGHVLTELLETERIYVTEMASILRGYRDQMVSEEMASLVPPSLQGKEDILFGNLHELYKFHSEVFLKDLENCISTTELVALCFVQRRDTFYRLYSFYCQNIPRSERLRETLVDAHLFLQECQKRLGHKLPLAAYLLKPVQRITKYQLLLKDLLRFSDSGTCTKELQKALDCMLIVLKCVNDSMHQIAITGFPSDLSQQGELLLQDSFQVWTESKKDIRLRLKTQQRHIFLYQKVMLLCKQGSKTGHNKSTYQYKHHVNMSQIGLTESVRGDPKRFEVWLQGRQEVHTIQAPSIEIKNKWVTEIKKVLLNQLEELKGENIKQYGLNHKPLRHTTSWDTPCAAIMTTQRAMSCDTSDLNRHSNGSDDGAPSTPGMGSLSSERDSQDAGGWSSDYSNSEDELSIIEDSSTPGSRFIALADYCAVGHSEVSMKEGETVELLKIGCAGWWFVRVLDTNVEGWTPAAYLGPANRKSSRSCSRNQDKIN